MLKHLVVSFLVVASVNCEPKRSGKSGGGGLNGVPDHGGFIPIPDHLLEEYNKPTMSDYHLDDEDYDEYIDEELEKHKPHSESESKAFYNNENIFRLI